MESILGILKSYKIRALLPISFRRQIVPGTQREERIKERERDKEGALIAEMGRMGWILFEISGKFYIFYTYTVHILLLYSAVIDLLPMHGECCKAIPALLSNNLARQ